MTTNYANNAADENVRKAVSEVSPEGRPAEGFMGKRAIFLLIGMAAAAVVLGALLIGVVGMKWGIAAAVALALVGFVLVNPSIWAAVNRGKERDELASGSTPIVEDRPPQDR